MPMQFRIFAGLSNAYGYLILTIGHMRRMQEEAIGQILFLVQKYHNSITND